MSQVCYECGHETPLGKPLEHFAVCVMVSGQLDPHYIAQNTSQSFDQVANAVRRQPRTATTFPTR